MQESHWINHLIGGRGAGGQGGRGRGAGAGGRRQGEGGRRRGQGEESDCAHMCVSKSEGHNI